MRRVIRESAFRFEPSDYSYGAADPGVETTEDSSTAENVTAWMPAIKTALGLDDPRKATATLENRLRDLKYGTPAERVAAMAAAGSFTIEGAVAKTERKLQEARQAAFQTRTRDALYTTLTITGVVAGGALTLFLLSKTYATLQDTKR